MIPKIIHYCWLSNDPYPEDLKRCMATWKEKLPDYEFMLWNFDRFDKSSSLWVQQAFDNKKYAFAADYIRLFAVYNYGGIYMDMDIEVLKSFNDLLGSDLIFAYENKEKTGIEAGCFGAQKGNPVIKKCLDYYNGKSFIKQDGSFDVLPLPAILLKIITNCNISNIKDNYTFTCKSYQTGQIEKKSCSYAIHNFAGSWTSKAQQKYDKIRIRLYSVFPCSIAKMISIFPFVIWQISDNGLYGFLKKLFKKVTK